MKGVELVRGAGRLELLKLLLEYPGRKFTIRELALNAKVPYGTAWYAIEDFWKARIIDLGLVGRARTVKLKNISYVKKLVKLSDFPSPHVSALGSIKKELAKINEIKEAYLFGSVAKGTEISTSDIDLAVLVSKEVDFHKLLSTSYDKLGVTIVPLDFTNKKEFDDFLKDKEKVKLK
jgi:predicted nucleotidyltransferase